MSFFSQNIRFLRNKNGLNQAEMLSKLGIPRTTWSSYENGISQPSINGIIKIARFFEISVTELLEKDLKNDENIEKKKQGKELNQISGGQQNTETVYDILHIKQKIIESQMQIISALQNLVDRLTSDIAKLTKENAKI